MADEEVSGNQVEGQDTAVEEAEAKEQDLKELLKEAIQVEVKEIGVLRKHLTVTVPRDRLDAELDKDYKELISEAVVPGFRRGRAPRRLLEKRFGSEVGEQVRTRIVPNAFLAAVDKEDLKVIGDPLVWVKLKDKKAKTGEASEEKEQLVDIPTAMRHMKLPDEGDFAFRCEVEVRPQFELPELENVPIEKHRAEITEDDVTAEIDRWLKRRGNYSPVPEEGEVEEDDLLICDVRLTVDGKEIKVVDNAQLAARAQVFEGVVLERFGDELEGAKLGDLRKLQGTLPDDHPLADLRGKKADFEFKINEIKRLKLPPLDQTLLSEMGFDSEKEYRSFVKDQLQARVGEETERDMRAQVRKHLLDCVKLDLPEGISSRQTERVAMRKMIELQRFGVPMAEIQKHADELRTRAREEAAAELKLHFILEEIAEKLEIEVTEEEVNNQIAAMARSYNRRFDRVRDELARNNGLDSLYLEIRDEKCVNEILKKAKITEAEVKPKPKPAGKKKSAKAEKRPGEPALKAKPQRKPPKKSRGGE